MYLKSIMTMLLSLIALLAPSCSSSQVRVGFVGSQIGSRMDYDYRVFSGQETITFDLDPGQILDLDYELEVERGSITCQLTAPGGEVIWDKFFEEDEKGSERLQIELDGIYQLKVSGSKAKGGFDIDWELQTEEVTGFGSGSGLPE